jgi:hypothetical protein
MIESNQGSRGFSFAYVSWFERHGTDRNGSIDSDADFRTLLDTVGPHSRPRQYGYYESRRNIEYRSSTLIA